MLLKQNLSLSLSKELIEQMDILKSKFGLSRSELAEKLLIESLEIKLLNDAKELSNMKFDDLPDEDSWLVLQNN